MSFKPLKAQIELALENAPVCFPEPDPATPGVPGGPATSPARATSPLRPATAIAQTMTANVLRMRPTFLVLLSVRRPGALSGQPTRGARAPASGGLPSLARAGP